MCLIKARMYVWTLSLFQKSNKSSSPQTSPFDAVQPRASSTPAPRLHPLYCCTALFCTAPHCTVLCTIYCTVEYIPSRRGSTTKWMGSGRPCPRRPRCARETTMCPSRLDEVRVIPVRYDTRVECSIGSSVTYQVDIKSQAMVTEGNSKKTAATSRRTFLEISQQNTNVRYCSS